MGQQSSRLKHVLAQSDEEFTRGYVLFNHLVARVPEYARGSPDVSPKRQMARRARLAPGYDQGVLATTAKGNPESLGI